MERVPVTSSSLAAIGYSRTDQILEVEFKHGASYQYLDVPTDLFDAFIAAHSKGTFFNHSVKGRYDFVQVRR